MAVAAPLHRQRGRCLPELPWISVAQMRDVDRLLVDELRISLPRLMENAGRNLALLARELLGGDAGGASIAVLAGPGGNGGGGLAAARHPVAAGAHVEVALAAEELSPAAAEQLAIVRRLGVHEGARGEPELVLDALLGYGQRGAPRGKAARLIEWSADRRVLALDVPSGSSSRPAPCTSRMFVPRRR